MNIAVEYQGDQHFRPVEFFGGKEAFKKQQERDKIKKLKCEENNCDLIYVLPDYDAEKLLKKLSNMIKKKNST